MTSYLDTRELYKRQCELQEELDKLNEAVEAAQEEFDDIEPGEENQDELDDLVTAREELYLWQGENQEELDELNDLENEVGREWAHGETLIPEEDFKDYAWPYSCIDWDQAADELRQDYTEVDFQGNTYLLRS